MLVTGATAWLSEKVAERAAGIICNRIVEEAG